MRSCRSHIQPAFSALPPAGQGGAAGASPSASRCKKAAWALKESWGPEWAVGAAPAAAILQVWLATCLSGGSALRIVRFGTGGAGWGGNDACSGVQCLQ